jgi:hypothetical protein
MLLVFCSESLCPGQADMQVHASRGHASPHNPGPPGALTAQIEAQKRERIDPVAGTLGGLSAARGGLPNESPVRQCSSREMRVEVSEVWSSGLPMQT